MKTTDPQDELFDVVDKKDNIIGATTRSIANKNKNLIHRAVTVLVFKSNELLVQRRSGTKDTYPNYWTSSCSGHVLAGDTYEPSAIRELEEELGVFRKGLTFLKKKIIRYPSETECMSFYAVNLKKEETIQINKREISEFKFLKLNKTILSNFIKSEKVTPDFEYAISILNNNFELIRR